MTYNETVFPNIFSHQSQEQAFGGLQQFLPIINSGCSPVMRPFLCSVFLPKCSESANRTIPCKELCEAAMDGCTNEIKSLSIPWPKELECDNLPQNNTCLSIDFKGKE